MSADRLPPKEVDTLAGGPEGTKASTVEEATGGETTMHGDEMDAARDVQLAQIDAALDALMAVVGDAPGAGKDDELESLVLYHASAFITDPRVLNRAGIRLATAQEQGDQEVASKLQRIIQSIEALQARDTEDLDASVVAAREFRETVEALNAYVGASSMEAASEVLAHHQEVLVTDLAVDLIEGKVADLRAAGEPVAANMLERGPLRLVKDVQAHGLERGLATFLDRDRQQAIAQARLGSLAAASGPKLVAAVDALLAARDAFALLHALIEGYSWLVLPDSATMLDEAETICRAGGTSDTEADHYHYLLSLLDRMRALAQGHPELAREEQARLALGLTTHD